MKGEIAKCNVCGSDFTKKMYTQVNCSAKCSTKSSLNKMIARQGINKFKIFARDGFKCFYCGKSSIEKDARLVLDHVVPQTIGGISLPENLVTCCTECNGAKLGMVLSDDIVNRIREEIKKRDAAQEFELRQELLKKTV